MEVTRKILFAFLFVLIFSICLVTACSEESDDDDDGKSGNTDDDDDATDDDDDDDDDSTDADPDETLDACVDFYTDCVKLEDDIAQKYCGIITQANEEGQCSLNAYAVWINCLIDNVDCDDWKASWEKIEECNDQLTTEQGEC